MKSVREHRIAIAIHRVMAAYDGGVMTRREVVEALMVAGMRNSEARAELWFHMRDRMRDHAAH